MTKHPWINPRHFQQNKSKFNIETDIPVEDLIDALSYLIMLQNVLEI